MSKTKQYTPRPYFNPIVLDEIENEDQDKNPNDSDSDRDGHHDTQDSVGDTATSENESTYEKRWKDLKKHYDTEVSSLRRKIKDLEESEKSSPSFTPPKTPEDIEAFRNKYPEFYDVMLSVAYGQANATVEKSSTRISELEEKLADAEREKALKVIEKAHADFVQIVNSAEFTNWLETQSSTIQSWVRGNSTDAPAFIRALDLYKLDNGLMTDRKDPSNKETANTFVDNSAAMEVSTKSNGVAVGESNKRTWSRKEIDRMSQTEFDKNEEELTLAMIEGRVIDDK